jgi:threonylcarbamoyladenosine tRNA methylthiotransferase MtaB
MIKPSFKIYTLGCKVNQYDSNYLQGRLLAWGLKSNAKKPELIIINTCAVTKVAMTKDRQLINKIRREHPRAKIAVIGCWPKISQEPILGADLILNIKNLDELALEIFTYISKTKTPLALNHAPIISNNDRARYFIKIQDGCRQFCSYCIIPHARGELQSRPAQEIIAEIKSATLAGYREIILSGIHLGLYGVDLPKKINLSSLLKKILKIKNLGRLRLSSIEINEVSDDLIKLIKSNRQICQHLHIPLQGGTDKILKAMKRPYDLKIFLSKIKKIRQALPDIAISTDIIVGFPGETAADFQSTYDLAKKIKFSKIHVFSFSAHALAPASKLPNQIKPPTIKERSQKLRALSTQLEKEYENKILQKYRHKKLAVILEKINSPQAVYKTEYYFDIKRPSQKLQTKNIGQLFNIKI